LLLLLQIDRVEIKARTVWASSQRASRHITSEADIPPPSQLRKTPKGQIMRPVVVFAVGVDQRMGRQQYVTAHG
jgi:hypothetical protein